MGLIGSIRKSIKLREISRSFDADTAVEAITERVIRGETTFQDHPLRKLFALSQLDPLLREVVDRHGVDQHRFDELFTHLMRTGAGQWEGGRSISY